MHFLLFWFVCGILSIPLGVLIQKLKDPGLNTRELFAVGVGSLFACMFFGPILMTMGLYRLIADIPMYQSKSTYVLRKFES